MYIIQLVADQTWKLFVGHFMYVLKHISRKTVRYKTYKTSSPVCADLVCFSTTVIYYSPFRSIER